MILGLRANVCLGRRIFWQVILFLGCVSFVALYARFLIDAFNRLSDSRNSFPTNGRVLRAAFKYSRVTGFLFEDMLFKLYLLHPRLYIAI